MKKGISLLLGLAFAFAVSACSSGNSASTASNSASAAASVASAASAASEPTSSAQTLEVDKNLLDVTITFPASMFEGTDTSQAIENAEAEGVQVTKNSDGSLTYKMSKETHKKLMDGMKKSTSDSLSQLKTSGDYESITDVKYNDDFSQISIVVNKAKYESSLDSFASLNAGLQGMFYQIFDGKDANHSTVKVDFVDETGKVIESVTYPDALKN